MDIGRTFTETPPASTPEEFLRHVREGRAAARGEQGSAAKWAHSAMALATRALLAGRRQTPAPPQAKPKWPRIRDADRSKIAERVVARGSERGGEVARDLGPDDARAVLRAWLDTAWA